MNPQPSQLGASDRRMLRDVVWVLGSFVVVGLGGIAANAYIAATLGSAALGVFNQAFAIYIVLSQVAVGGLQFSVLQQVSYHQNDRARCAEAATSALILVGLVSALVCAVAWLLRGWAGRMLSGDDVGVAIGLMLPGLFFYSLNKVLLYVLNGLRHMRAYSIFQSLRFGLILLAIAVLVAARRPGSQLTLSLTAAEIVLFLGLVAYVRLRLFSFTLGHELRVWYQRHMSYGLRGVLSGVLHEVNTRVDILMLGHFSRDDAAVGIYSFAALLAEGFAQIPLAVRTNVDPIIGQHLASNQREQLQAFSRKVRRIFFPLMLGMAAAAILLYPILLKLLRLDPTFRTSWLVFGILMAGIALNARMRPFLGILLQAGRPGVHTLLVGAVVTINAVLNLALVPWLGGVGAAAATACAFLVEAALIALLARKLVGVRL